MIINNKQPQKKIIMIIFIDGSEIWVTNNGKQKMQATEIKLLRIVEEVTIKTN